MPRTPDCHWYLPILSTNQPLVDLVHVHPLFLCNAPIDFGPDSTKNAEKTLNPPRYSLLTTPTSSQNFPPQRLAPICNPSFWDLVQCHHTSLTSWNVFFSRMVSLWRVISQIPNKQTKPIEMRHFLKKIWFFQFFWNEKQVIQLVSPTINATRDSSNSPRRHCDTVWPCSAACLYLKQLRYGKDQFNINRQARTTNDT